MASANFDAYESNLRRYFMADLIDQQMMLNVQRRPLLNRQTASFDVKSAWRDARNLEPRINLASVNAAAA